MKWIWPQTRLSWTWEPLPHPQRTCSPVPGWSLPEYLAIRDDPRFCHHFVRGRSGDYPSNGGFDTFWKKAVSAGQDWYIVYVGPFINLNSAKVNLKALKFSGRKPILLSVSTADWEGCPLSLIADSLKKAVKEKSFNVSPGINLLKNLGSKAKSSTKFDPKEVKKFIILIGVPDTILAYLLLANPLDPNKKSRHLQ